MWHSSWRHFTPPCGLVGALAVDEAQVAVGALRVVLLHAEEREAANTPRKAPSGQSTRHQNRGMKRFMNRIATSRKTMNQVWWK